MALKPCITCGTPTRSARCPAHTLRNGSTRSWRTLRAEILYRDAYRCQRCGMAANHVDHVQPVLFGGTSDPSNLQALCQACNLAKGADPPAAA